MCKPMYSGSASAARKSNSLRLFGPKASSSFPIIVSQDGRDLGVSDLLRRKYPELYHIQHEISGRTCVGRVARLGPAQ